jgi:hypothetical protein
MSAWLYLLIPVAMVGGTFLGIRFGRASRRSIVWPISGFLGGSNANGEGYSGGDGHSGGDGGGGGGD